MTAADALNAEFGIAGQLNFRADASGLVVAEIDNAHATASLCLQGAHLMTWRPKTEVEPVIWLSSAARLAAGKAIRGGIPICWPWFGPHRGDPGLPAHGFVRTAPWVMLAASSDADGATRLLLAPMVEAKSAAMPGADWRLRLTVIVGATLRLALATANTANGDAKSAADFVIEAALHTYLRVGDIATARLAGLAGGAYVDQLDGTTRRQHDASIGFSGETDRVYTGTQDDCVIEDAQLQRRIRIAKTGSASTVVWTPWRDKAARLGDLGPDDGWRQMLCVETANVRGDAVRIVAGGEHTMAVEISVESMPEG